MTGMRRQKTNMPPPPPALPSPPSVSASLVTTTYLLQNFNVQMSTEGNNSLPLRCRPCRRCFAFRIEVQLLLQCCCCCCCCCCCYCHIRVARRLPNWQQRMRCNQQWFTAQKKKTKKNECNETKTNHNKRILTANIARFSRANYFVSAKHKLA